MSRTRAIKPGFFKNEALGICSHAARLLAIGLTTIADREGRLEDRPLRIKAELFPYEAKINVDSLLSELTKAGFIIRYSQYIQIVKFKMHQYPHIKESASIIPAPDLNDTSIIQAPDKHKSNSPVNCLPSTVLPSTVNCLPLTVKPLTVEDKSSQARKRAVIHKEAKTSETWKAYKDAYWQRYGAEPVRNAKVNGQLSRFVDALGSQDAPFVAAFYLTHSNAYYIQRGHSVQAMLSDAEKLRTEWATGKKTTASMARQEDRTAGSGEVFRQLIEESKHGA